MSKSACTRYLPATPRLARRSSQPIATIEMRVMTRNISDARK
jgi:hypothetical protein